MVIDVDAILASVFVSDIPHDIRLMLSDPENVDILFELNDPDHSSRLHYSRATYARGCRGPLCQKAEKDRGRKRYQARRANAEKEYTPDPERRKESRDSVMNSIYTFHAHDLEIRRLMNRDARKAAS